MYYLFRKGYGLVARSFDFQNQKDMQKVREHLENAEPIILCDTLEDLEEFENVRFEDVNFQDNPE